MQVASALKMIYILFSIAGFYFLTHFLLENATAAMFNILKEDIYTKAVARHIWNYTIKYSHILKWNYRKKFKQYLQKIFKTYWMSIMRPPLFSKEFTYIILFEDGFFFKKNIFMSAYEEI